VRKDVTLYPPISLVVDSSLVPFCSARLPEYPIYNVDIVSNFQIQEFFPTFIQKKTGIYSNRGIIFINNINSSLELDFT